MRKELLLAFVYGALGSAAPLAQAAQTPRNVIIFVADGLRYGIVSPVTAPTLAKIQKTGVDFRNSHAVYPTVTTTNASVIATGHGVGDTGEWSNSVYFGATPLSAAAGHPTPGMENDAVLEEANTRYEGNYLNEVSLLKMARDHGYQTAAVGKEGPVLIQDISAGDGKSTIIIDDATGSLTPGRSVPLDPSLAKAILAEGLSLNPDDHKSNGSMYSDLPNGLKTANLDQQKWFTSVTTKVLLPRFVANGKPFALVYWSRDPDGTQHNTGDSINSFTPGINGPTSLAGVRNASDNLQLLIDALKANGVFENTDIFVTADHGFSTISRESKTSFAAHFTYADTYPGQLPPNFMAIDLSHALGLPLMDDLEKPLDPSQGEHPKGAARLGGTAAQWDALVVSSGGSYVIYLNPAKAHTLARQVVSALTHQDYVAGLFTSDNLGKIRGALSFRQIGLSGKALTPAPSIYVTLRDFALPSCVKIWKNPELCSVMVVDGNLKQGQGSHGGFTRANTRNFMAAAGPDFKSGYIDLAPVSNADITPTLAHILGFTPVNAGSLTGRSLKEALAGGPATVPSTPHVIRAERAANGFITVLETQSLGKEVYLDAAGMPGRVLGLKSLK